ncbi:MAG: type II toxin-antitoxin system RelE/ParE family toxin [Verrucomicrobiae bacterium]|nr:type II toxin-antitoxin system RelE/ParE family toxin [Verrucomicrobiae bacterium]
MRVDIQPEATEDIWAGYLFYEEIQEGLGADFYSALMAEILNRLPTIYSIKPLVTGNVRWLLTDRFPWAIYYSFDDEVITVHAVLDCRQNPDQIRNRLTED